MNIASLLNRFMVFAVVGWSFISLPQCLRGGVGDYSFDATMVEGNSGSTSTARKRSVIDTARKTTCRTSFPSTVPTASR